MAVKHKNDEAGEPFAPEANSYTLTVELYDVAKKDALQLGDCIETLIQNQGISGAARVVVSHIKSARAFCG